MMQMKPWMVMCCGCGRLLNKDGSTGVQIAFDGVLNYATFCNFTDEQKKVIADFDTKQEADAAAVKAGWAVEDREGPNHRCAKCLAIHKKRKKWNKAGHHEEKPRGAYISSSIFNRGGL
jgi:hypothetical protein